MGDMCPKDGIWECVVDPLPECLEGILPDGRFGCCSQLENWSLSEFSQETQKCRTDENICTTPENSARV